MNLPTTLIRFLIFSSLLVLISTSGRSTSPETNGESRPPVAVPRTSQGSPSTAPAQSESTPDDPSLLESLRTGIDALERRDQLQRDKVDRIAQESICETVERLLYEEAFAMAGHFQGSDDGRLLLEQVHAEPRVQKLMGFRAPGFETERQETLDCIEVHIQRYLHALPSAVPEGQRAYIGASVVSTPGAGAVALVLAELDDQGEQLATVVQLHTRDQEARQESRSASVNTDAVVDRYIASMNGAMFQAAEIVLLERIVARHEKGTQPTPALAQCMSEFGALYGARTAVSSVGDVQRPLTEQADVYRIARDFVEAQVKQE